MKKLFLLLLMGCTAVFGQLSGTYYIGATTGTRPGGGDPDYASLSAAFTALNSSGVNGACTFYLLDASYTEATDLQLGCSGTSASNTITIKPYTGVTSTISITDVTSRASGIDGSIVIGTTNYANTTSLVPTSYVIFDGSNTVSGTTKDLTISGPSTAVQKSVFRIYGNNDNLTFKNLNITVNSTSGSSVAPINITNRHDGTNQLAPDNMTIQNNTLSSVSGNGCTGIHISQSGTPTDHITGLTVSGNTINAKQRGMFVSYTKDANIFNNIFSLVSSASQGSASVTFQTGSTFAGTFNVYNNRFSTLTTLNTTAGANNGAIAIDMQMTTPKVFNVYNNFIYGMGPGASTTTNSKIYGIRATSSGTYNVYHNTIYLPQMTDMTTFGTSFIAGIVYASTGETGPTTGGTMNAKNNIIVSDETGATMKVYAIRRGGTSGTFNSDHNNLFINASHANGYIGMDNGVDQQSFANWLANTTYDDNSNNVAVTFTSTTDLHLSGGSDGDANLIGTTGLGISTDIDGESRSGSIPYMGADEGTAGLPVELTSFTAVAKGKNVELKWSTATETNNHGFDIERSVNGSWTKIGFVQGAGSSNAPKEYGYVDAVNQGGRISYRLKQIDRDGKFTYNNSIEVVINTTVSSYELGQNFPNPFNPVTTIRFSVKQLEQASVRVYDVTGKQVAELFNGMAAPGQVYNVQFNGTGLASGMYLYVLQTPTAREVKKMSMLK